MTTTNRRQNDKEGAVIMAAPVTTAPALPEAPVSVTVKLGYKGHDLMVTLRGHDGREVLTRLDGALTYLEANGATPATGRSVATTAGPAADGPVCPVHHRPMKQGQRGGYYCPTKVAEDDGTGKPVYCKQRAAQ